MEWVSVAGAALATIVPVVGVVLVLLAVVIVVVFSRFVFQIPDHRWATDDDVPPHLPAHLAPALDELAALGFEGARFVVVRPSLRAQGKTRVKALLHHPGERAWAFVGTSDTADGTDPFVFSFHAYFADRPSIITANLSRSGQIVDYPGVDLVDPRAPTTAGIWEAHRAACRTAGSAPLALDGDGCLAHEQAQDLAFLHAMVSARVLRPIDDSSWRYSVRGLARVLRAVPGSVLDVRRLRAARKRAAASARGAARAPVAVPIEEQVEAYLRTRATLEGEKKRKRWGWILVASGLAFALSLKGSVPVASLLALVGVIALHEGGHYLAMRAFGYRDTSVFFIPFLGAATIGRKEDATAFQEFVVLLAGPLPGLVLAVLLRFGSFAVLDRPELTTAIDMLLFINLLNLLPIMPLDGGRIVHLLLFSRHPVADLLFTVSGAGLLAVAAWAGHEPALAVFAGALALGSLQQIRASRIAALLRDAPVEALADETSRLRLTFQALHTLGYGKLAPARRHALVRLVTQLRRPRPPGCLGTLVGLAVYAASLVAVPITAAILWLGVLAPELPGGKRPAPSPFMAGPRTDGTKVECRDGKGPERRGPAASAPSPATWILAPSSAEEARRWADEPARAAALRGDPSASQPVERVVAWDRLVFVAGGREPAKRSEDTETDETDLGDTVPRRSERISLAPPGGWVASRETQEDVEVALVCHATDADVARALAADVDERLAELVGMNLRPLWVPSPALTLAEAEAEQRAWATYRTLRASEPPHEPARRLAPWKVWWEMVTAPSDPEAGKQAAEARRAERHAKARARVEEAIARARERGPLDEEIVTLYRDAAAPGYGPAKRDAAQRLGARLGQSRVERNEDGIWSSTRADQVHEMWGDPRAEGAELWFTSASFPAIDTGLPEVVDYLCSRSCSSVEYWLKQGASDDEED